MELSSIIEPRSTLIKGLQMVGSQLARALGVLELLAESPRGLPLQDLADRLDIPKSGTHRLLAELSQLRYVTQDGATLRYLLTTRLMSLGFKQLGGSGIVEVAQPILNNLATVSGELVRLALVDQGHLPFVAKAQGASTGLRYDPEMGAEAALYCSSTGLAWLATMPENEAVEHVIKQGFTLPEQRGERVPKTIGEVLALVEDARQRGFACVSECWAPGMTSMAAVVRDAQTSHVFAVISIAGPTVRMGEPAIQNLAPALFQAAQELAAFSPLSHYQTSITPETDDAQRKRIN